MTILDDAIGLEERSRAYYAAAVGRVSDPSGKKILTLLVNEEKRHAELLALTLLVNEEKRHAELLAKMKDGLHGELAHSPLLQDVRGLVEGAVKEGKNAISSDGTLREILQKAMEIEQATKRFYEEKAISADDDKVKDLFTLFTKLARQETSHYLLVSSLAEYFDRPAEWVESAEFGLRSEY